MILNKCDLVEIYPILGTNGQILELPEKEERLFLRVDVEVIQWLFTSRFFPGVLQLHKLTHVISAPAPPTNVENDIFNPY